MTSPPGPAPSPALSFRPHPVVAAAFFVGAALATSFLKSMYEWHVVLLAAAATTAIWAASGLTASRARLARWTGRVAWVLLVGFYAFCAYFAALVGVVLAWTVPTWGWLAVASTGIAALAGLLRPRARLRLPIILPLGIWIAVALSGWLREETLLRCDDRLALRPPVELLVPNPVLAACRPGHIIGSGRFPRTIWEAPDGKRLVFTSQGEQVPGGLSGSVCEMQLGTDAAPICVGPPFNKSQGLIDLPDAQRLLAMQWGVPTPSGSRGAVVFELPRGPGIAILGEHWFDRPLGDGFYEPRNATLYMFSDEMDAIYRTILPEFAPAPPIPIEFAPGEIRYDPSLGEGVACGGGIGAAVRGDPFAFRYFREANSSPIETLSMTWGCDWDPRSRKVYSTIPNLGLLDRIDYDTGRVEQRWFVGPGLRSVAYDPQRGRVYLGNFLRGYVLAWDERAERIVDRWFVGRFNRWVRLTRDRRALLASGNLGIARIPLPD